MTVPATQWRRELAHAALIGWAGLDRAGWAVLIDAAVGAGATRELLCMPGVLATVDLVRLSNRLVARGDPAAELLLMSFDDELRVPASRWWLAAACLGWPARRVEQLRAADPASAGWRVRWALGAARRPHTVLRGYLGVTGLCALPLPDGRVGLCAAGYGGILRWDAGTGKPLGDALYDDDEFVSICAVPRPSGRVLLAAGGDNGNVCLVDPIDGPVGEFPATTDGAPVDGLCTIALAGRSRDDPILVTSSSAEPIVRLWDLSSGEQFGQIQIEGDPAGALCALPLADGRDVFATAHAERMLVVWDPGTGQPVNAFPTDHRSDVDKLCAVPHPDGRVMLASTDGATVRLWDPTTGEPAGVSFASGHGETIVAICPVPRDGRMLVATASDDCTARLWDAVTGEPVTGALTGHPAYVHAVCPVPLPDGRVLLATGGYDGSVRLWDVMPGSPIYPRAAVDVHDVDRLGAVARPDGRVVLVSGHFDGAVRYWDPATGQPVEDFIEPPDLEQVCVLPMPDGRSVEARFEERWIRLWDPRTDREVGGENLHCALDVTDRIADVCAVPTPDGRVLLAAGSVAGLVTVWDPATEAELGRIVHFGPLRALAGLPGGRLAVAGGHCLCVMDMVGQLVSG
jgi:WD40 repeat protein